LINKTEYIVNDVFVNKHHQYIFTKYYFTSSKRSSWSWSYDSWIYNYMCKHCLSPL